MFLTVFGRHGPYPRPGGACSGYYIEDGPTRVLIDCGAGVLSRLMEHVHPARLDAIVLSHLHFDHFDVPTLKAILPDGAKTVLVAPQAVADKVPEALQDRIDLKVLNQGEKIDVDGIPIEAVPAYNTTSGHEKFHPRSRDNGYLLTLGGKRFYIAGDTEDTPEMRALKNIDVAFLPMNQPYTLSVPQAADAIKAFKPKIVYPYHFRSDDGTKADFAQLQKLVGKDAGVEIRVLDWYPGE